MKVLHVARQFYPCIGGVENFVLNLAKHQNIMGHDVSVLTLNRSFADGNIIAGPNIYEGIRITRIPYFGSRRYPISLSCIDHVKECDILHVHCVDFFIDYLALLKFRHRKKIFLHTHGGYFHTKWMVLAKAIYFQTATRLALRGCEKVIACSENDYKLFSGISGNVARIDNGVDVEKFSHIDKNVEPGSLLYVGRIDKNKRVDDLIRAVAKIRDVGLTVQLKVIGPDYSRLVPGLQRLTRDLGLDNVKFLGMQNDESLKHELSRAHIFVSASGYEAFGISAVEAMASGTVCVLNDIPAFRGIVLHGQTGFITDFTDSRKAADQIIRILSISMNEYDILGKQARLAANKYDWRKVAVEITELYS